MTDLTAVLLIDVTSSRCGNCHEPVLVSAIRHVDVSGWDPKPGGGCGARFTTVRSTSRAVDDEDLRRVRPDLPIHPAP